MADESDPRAHRPNEVLGANARSGDSDPVVELARWLGHNDPFADFRRRETRGHPSERHAVALNFDVRPCGAHAGDCSDAYQADAHTQSDDDHGIYGHAESWIERQEIYHAQAHTLRRHRLIAVMAVVALAAVGTAGSFGYRAMSTGSRSAPPPRVMKADMEPSKVVPPIQTDEPRSAFPPPNPPNSPPSTASVANSPSPVATPPAESAGAGLNEPKKSAAQTPTRAAAAPNPPAQAAPVGAARSYVQISSRRSETDAKASFKTLQGKYPKVLGGKRVVIRRAELGDRGVHYRAMVGPFAGVEQAAGLCSRLKAAGGQCVVQRN